MIELGGNIKLDGFEGLEPALLIVVKKVVGNYAKKISEKIDSNEAEVTVELKKDEKKSTVISRLKFKDKEIEVKDAGENLFFVLDKSLAKLLEKA